MKLTSYTKSLHIALRNQKTQLFLRCLSSDSGELLDVGGDFGMNGEFLPMYSRFHNVTILNRQAPDRRALSNSHIKFIQGDGCDMPFEDRQFDWVFSNAVIEHVGGWDKQKRFANEIRRIAKHGYFVATPNRYFPVEPHTYLPFYQFLPTVCQHFVVRFSPGWERTWNQIDLLSARQLRILFPDAEVLPVGPIPVKPNLIAFARYES